MSLLAPLYFAGALAIGLPILFHLIRRQPKGNIAFSSLMFLKPTPPQLTRRSRLDNWLLLLIRSLAILLLAAAFARPFFRTEAVTDSDASGQRFVVLIDTSASMKRVGVWDQAIGQVDRVIGELGKNDQLAIIGYDDDPKTLFPFEQSYELAADQRFSVARLSLQDLVPSWRNSDLGRALVYAADMAAASEADQEGDQRDANLILISDMQSGSEIESLQRFTWPENVKLDVRAVRGTNAGNAWVRILQSSGEDNDAEGDPIGAASKRGGSRTEKRRVRVSNAAGTNASDFRLTWTTSENKTIDAMPVHVPPGESRTVSIPLPDANVTSLVLSGDQEPFDNAAYLVRPQPETANIVFVGDQENKQDPRDRLLYYLEQVPFDTPQRTVTITSDTNLIPGSAVQPSSLKTTPLVVVTQPLDEAMARRIGRYADAGGTVLLVLAEPDANWSSTLVALIENGDEEAPGIEVSEAKLDDYAMLSHIDFEHPVFSPMADPQFNDFTKTRFWSHREIHGLPADTKVLAKFDDGDPALIEHSVGDGHLIVLAAGWQPQASQLSLSTKFIPLMFSIFDRGQRARADGNRYRVGDRLDEASGHPTRVAAPEGDAPESTTLDSDNRLTRPGVYRMDQDGKLQTIAVNLADSESHVEPMDAATLEKLGVQLGKAQSNEVRKESERQSKDVELESNQKLWQWLMAAAMGLLVTETLLVRIRQ
ncbi:BatA domain-containing protein [Novipirellula rosea]|uniref:BatA domain-containing protein n=1 Tax=Novipirellula rosea TaxID=1031540 RepID=A0ABP8NUP6_9BACT